MYLNYASLSPQQKENRRISRKKYWKAHRNICRQRTKEYFKKHPEARLKYRQKARVKFRSILNQLKNKPCLDCQGWFAPCQMEFDHRDAKIKSFEIGSRYCSSIITLKQEIDKCDLVCSNCHRLRTWKRSIGKDIHESVIY